MELSDFILDSCKVTPGFEFYPKKNKKIDVKELIKHLTKEGYYISKDNYLHPYYDYVQCLYINHQKLFLRSLDYKNL